MSWSSLWGAMARRRFVAVALALPAVAVAAGCGGAPPPQPTTTVQRGEVATRVSSSGALAAVTSTNLGFANAGQLRQLNVRVGDTVKPGQVLAREDPFAFQQVLNQQQAQLRNAQAQLNLLVNNQDVSNGRRTYEQAKDILEATRRNRDKQLNLDETTIRRDEVALDFAEQQLRINRKAAELAAQTHPKQEPCPQLGDGYAQDYFQMQRYERDASPPEKLATNLGALGSKAASGDTSSLTGAQPQGSSACQDRKSVV